VHHRPRRPPRRLFVALAGGTLFAPALLVPRKAAATPLRTDALSFLHTHTGEALQVAFRAEGEYVPSALRAVDRFLRDHRTGDARPIDPALLDQLHRLAQVTGTRAPFQVISAFRSDRTNAMLRARGGGGVARASLHMEGRAIDIRLADVALDTVRDAARSLTAGGVGYYAASDFVHLDTGRVRHW